MVKGAGSSGAVDYYVVHNDKGYKMKDIQREEIKAEVDKEFKQAMENAYNDSFFQAHTWKSVKNPHIAVSEVAELNHVQEALDEYCVKYETLYSGIYFTFSPIGVTFWDVNVNHDSKKATKTGRSTETVDVIQSEDHAAIELRSKYVSDDDDSNTERKPLLLYSQEAVKRSGVAYEAIRERMWPRGTNYPLVDDVTQAQWEKFVKGASRKTYPDVKEGDQLVLWLDGTTVTKSVTQEGDSFSTTKGRRAMWKQQWAISLKTPGGPPFEQFKLDLANSTTQVSADDTVTESRGQLQHPK